MPKTSVPILNYSVYLESQYCKKQLYFSQRKEHWDNGFFFHFASYLTVSVSWSAVKVSVSLLQKEYIDFMLFCSYTILLLSTYLTENVDIDCRGNKVVSFGLWPCLPFLTSSTSSHLWFCTNYKYKKGHTLDISLILFLLCRCRICLVYHHYYNNKN